MGKINLDYLNELGGGDADFTIEMLETYLEETSRDMDELQTALDEDNLKRIGFVAHRTKAAFRMLGLDEITEIAQELESTAKKGKVSAKLLTVPINNLIADARVSFEEAKELIADLKRQ